MKENIKMHSIINKNESIILSLLFVVILIDSVGFPIITRSVMPSLGRANWLEITFRFCIDLVFIICIMLHRKSFPQLLIPFLAVVNYATLFPVLFRYGSFVRWLSPVLVTYVLFRHYDKSVAWTAFIIGLLCLVAFILPLVSGFDV